MSRKEVDRALEIREAVAATVEKLFPDDPKLYSYMAYKLGGMYARNGRPEEAVEAVSDALKANPSLIQWVEQDADLEPLMRLALKEIPRHGSIH